MDWARAIKINRTALSLIVAEIYALLGIVRGGMVERLPHSLYAAVERLLRPTESALRRLIVIAARGMVVKPSIPRPMPKGLVIAAGGSGAGSRSFRLFDTRKRYDFIEVENPLFATVKTYNSFPNPLFNPLLLQRPEEPEGSMKASSLCRRLAAVAHALENIPHQAQRLARWKAKRENMKNPKFTAPLRPGRPPGYSDKPKIEIDYILKECHALANDAFREESS
jgi:hypothetical protein